MLRFFKPLAEAGRKIAVELPILAAGVGVGYATRKILLAGFKHAQPYIAPELKEQEAHTATPSLK
ncbi:hypothetical protein [Legionella sp. km772]|uniref:hypothetical protein n=1 Tax=Legionella sp. km772 TaxID=2498111 RepID=UPI000F8C7266|nr:hypothetical protein [Legionella sp. km772]RUR07728.1 hypothetical protein ELY15_11845 [Legionella sp. km772]